MSSVKVEYRNEENLRISSDDSDAYINLNQHEYVLLRPISIQELRSEFKTFEKRLRIAFKKLFCMPASEVVSTYGQMDLNASLNSDRGDLEYGLVSRGGEKWRRLFTSLEESAVLQALIHLGCVESHTAKGTPRTRLRTMQGGVATVVLDFDSKLRIRIIEAAFDLHADLDDVLRINQTSLIGLRELRELLSDATDANGALASIAVATHKFYTEQKTVGSGRSTKRGSGRIFAPAWFAQHLATSGIWATPAQYIDGIINLYPAKWRPIGLWMSVTDSLRPFAERINSLHLADPGKSSRVLPVFLALAQCSSAWDEKRVQTFPLIAFKQLMQLEKASGGHHESAAINKVYRGFCEFLSVPTIENLDSVHLIRSTRLAGKGVEPFDWCEHPNTRNFKRPSKILGKEIRVIPPHVKEWARYLRDLLPLFGVRGLENQVHCLNLWLCFLLSLPSENVPRDFSEVIRHLHINNTADNGAKDASLFVGFAKNASSLVSENTLYRVIPTLQKAWLLAATRDGFSGKSSNPFDPKLDQIVPPPARPGRTVRHALDEEVWKAIVEENRKDDLGFARTYGGKKKSYWYRVLDPQTTRYTEVFFPILPTLIDALLHSGMRKSSARWLDSGEFDEEIVDLDTMTVLPNPSPNAVVGRKESFLQLRYMPRQTKPVLGMYINTNKTSDGYEVPWIDEGLARNVKALEKVQRTFNPLKVLIKAVDPSFVSKYIPKEMAIAVAPLFRDPANDIGFPVSEAKVAQYWEALLRHCQPVIDARLKYHYPLFEADGTPRFDIHSLRVTTVTMLIRAGVSPEIVQTLVGHMAMAMTWHYRKISPDEVHRALRKALDRIWASLSSSAGDPDEEIEAIVREAVTQRDTTDFAGADLLRRHQKARSAPLMLWTHGICPGGDCTTGGERLADGKYAPVWRPGACSECRFRVTGPRFLFGLVIRLNGLMQEIRFSARKEADLNLAADDLDDEGRPDANLRALAQKERDMRENLWREWIAEYRTVLLCEDLLAEVDPTRMNELLPVRGDFAREHFLTRLEEVHELELAHDLVKSTRSLPEASQAVPFGTEAYRNGLLHQVLRANNMEDLIYRLEPKAARKALDLFGDSLFMHIGEPSQLQQVIEGTRKMNEFPELASAVDAMSRLAQPSSRLETSGTLA